MGGGCCPKQKVTLRNRCYFSPLPNVVVAMPDTRRIVGPETSQSPYNLCSSFRASSLKVGRQQPVKHVVLYFLK